MNDKKAADKKTIKVTQTGSLIESLTNVLVGFVITLIVSPLIYWLCGIDMSLPRMGAVTVCFTVVSVVRSYIIRRFFNRVNL